MAIIPGSGYAKWRWPETRKDTDAANSRPPRRGPAPRAGEARRSRPGVPTPSPLSRRPWQKGARAFVPKGRARRGHIQIRPGHAWAPGVRSGISWEHPALRGERGDNCTGIGEGRWSWEKLTQKGSRLGGVGRGLGLGFPGGWTPQGWNPRELERLRDHEASLHRERRGRRESALRIFISVCRSGVGPGKWGGKKREGARDVGVRALSPAAQPAVVAESGACVSLSPPARSSPHILK